MMHRARVVGHVLMLTARADWKIVILIVTIVAAQAGSTALVALAQRWIVDYSGAGITVGLITAAIIGALAYTASAAGNRVQTNLRGDLGERVDLTLNREILSDVTRIPTIEHLERAEFLDRLTALRNGTRELAASCWSVAETVASLVSLGLSVWLLASVHPVLALLAILGIPPLWIARRTQRAVQRVLDKSIEDVRLEQQLHDLCVQPEPAKEIWIAGNGPELSRRASLLWTKTADLETRARIIGAVWQLAGWACYMAGLGIALVVIASLIRTGSAGIGDIVLVISLGSQLRGQIAFAASGISRLGQAGHVTDHYLWLRDYASGYSSDGKPPPQRLDDGIVLDRVSFRYPGADTDTLRDLTLRLPAGSTVGLVGINGAGKTTLVKLLAGMHRPTSGAVTVDGTSVSDLDSAGWCARLTGAFQDFVKIQAPVRESVGVGDLSVAGDLAKVAEAIDRAGASDLVDTMPAGLDTQLGTVFGGVELSHGQWQKLALARGMMREQPLLLVLDEPTAALDPQAEHDLFERFAVQSRTAAVHSGAITILVSHRFSTVHMADHIVVLDNGGVAEQGSHAELMSLDGSYASLYRTQAAGYA